jgi:hypothetical protein
MALVTSPYGPQFLLPDYMVPPERGGEMPPLNADLLQVAGAPPPPPPPPPPTAPPPRDGVRPGTTQSIGQGVFDNETAPPPITTSAEPPPVAVPPVQAVPPAAVPAQASAPPPAAPMTASQAANETQAAYQDLTTAAQKATDVKVQHANEVLAAREQHQRDQEQIVKEADKERQALDAERANKRASMDAIRTKLDNTKIDPDRYWHNASTGKQVGWLIGMIMSGMGQAMGGKGAERNPVLGMLDQVIERDIKLQEDARDQLEKQFGRARQDINDLDRFSSDRDARALARLAQGKELLAGRMEMTAAKHAAPMAQAELLKTAALYRKEAAEAGDAAIERAAQAAHRDKQARLAESSNALAWVKRADDRADADRRFKLEERRIFEEAQKAIQQGNLKQADAIVKGAIGGAVDEKGDLQLLKQKDGQVFIVDDKAKPELVKQRSAVQDLHNYMGQIRQLREKHGGTSSTTDPATQAEYERLTNSAVIAYAAAKGLSMADKQSQDYARNAILGDDPSKYYALRDSGVVDRIDRALTDVTSSYHTTLRGLGFNGELPKFADPRKNAPTTSPDLQSVLEADTTKKTGRPARQDEVGKPGTIGFTTFESNVAPAVRQTLENMEARARSQDPTVQRSGLNDLTVAAQSATDPQVRAWAKAALERAQVAITPGTTEQPTLPVRATARDTLAPGARR